MKKNSKKPINSKNILSEINANNKKFWEKTSKQFFDAIKSHPHALEHATQIVSRGIACGSLEDITLGQVEFLKKDKAVNGKKGGHTERGEKLLIKAEWDAWQKNPTTKYHGRVSEFSREMLKKYSPDSGNKSEIGAKTINRWCTEWKKAQN